MTRHPPTTPLPRSICGETDGQEQTVQFHALAFIDSPFPVAHAKMFLETSSARTWATSQLLTAGRCSLEQAPYVRESYVIARIRRPRILHLTDEPNSASKTSLDFLESPGVAMHTGGDINCEKRTAVS